MYKKLRIILLFAVLLAGTNSRDTRAMKELIGTAFITGGLLFAGAVGLWTYCAGAPAREKLSAASDGDLDRVKQLIKSGISVNIQGSGNNTALHLASFNGHFSVARYLIEQGADVSIKNSSGSTPLHLAVFSREFGLIKDLVQAGADVAVKDAFGKTPVQLINGQTGVIDQKIQAYFVLATDFYRVVNGALIFGEFARKYLEVQDNIVARTNRLNLCRLLHLGSKELADQCYEWLKKSSIQLPLKWEDRVDMYLDLMRQSLDSNKKLYWCEIAEKMPHNCDLTIKIAKKLYKELDKPENSLFKKAYAHQTHLKNLETLSKNLVSKKPGLGFADLKIKFKT